ncbi:Ger(x)C family spore germination protein [Paenibacillus sp. P25]|nr:Ger(x)C family spore germination protein [Paenibacillus sp. P25]
MNWMGKAAAGFSLLFLLTGCWDQAELPEKGFVMGLAIDQVAGGRYLLTTQIFKPTQVVGGKGNEKSYINIMAEDASIAKAIRDIPGHLGRKLQWSHMRIIIMGEELARKQGLADVLDFFYRDHEPRIISPVMITQGRASDYLRLKPLIENTISQRLYEGQRQSEASNAKTLDMNLLLLGRQTRSEVGSGLIPYVFTSQIDHMTVMNIEGAALLKKGKMVSLLDGERMEGFQMLMNRYKSGMIRVPCERNAGGNKVETVELLSLHSDMTPDLRRRPPVFRYKIRIPIAVSEISCSGDITTTDKETAFTERVEQAIKHQLESTTGYLKKIKFDAMGLGNAVYRKNPRLWKQWKPEWEDIFAASKFEFEVEVTLVSAERT